MLRRLRENGPGLLVPAIWTVVAGAHLGAVTERTLLAAHVVMSVLLVAFVALSWGDMDAGVLRAWRRVILAGTPLALAGTAGLAGAPARDALLAVAIVGWMLAPAPAFVVTGRDVDRHSRVYQAAAVASVAGAVGYLVAWATAAGTTALVASVAVVGAGQTAGILAAVVDY